MIAPIGTKVVEPSLKLEKPLILSCLITAFMPFPMKIQPIDSNTTRESIRNDSVKPVLKSRLRRLFDRQFPSVLRISSAEKPNNGEWQYSKDGGSELEPSSVCLAKMVQNFIEESNDKPPAVKCGRSRCNCFNGNSNDSSDDELDVFGCFSESISIGTASPADAYEILKSLVPCTSTAERNLLADIAKIVETNKLCKRKEELRKIVIDGLAALGYDASICKSRWDKCPSYPAGEYDFIDAIIEGERLLIDIDFKSEFEIARSTGAYKVILQSLPHIFVGKADRLQQIISIVSEAAKQSLKKKGMPFPPWRKAEYMRAKWLSPYTRTASPTSVHIEPANKEETVAEARNDLCLVTPDSFSGEFELIFGEKISPSETDTSEWQPPAIKPKSSNEGGGKVVTGLASLLKEKP